MYVNSGNPSPDYDGSARPGMNLFTNATIALELETGRLAWYYQAIHHDLWDWDHVTGPLLFDAEHDGRVVKGVAAAGKNCLLYIWDRETGEPLNPMVETAVPTETDVPGEQVWPTQPIPYNARGVPMTPFCATFPILSDPEAQQRARQLYTPYSLTERYIVTHGGSSWGPPAFSPQTGLLYVSGKDGGITITVNPVGDSLVVGQSDGHMDSIADGPFRDDMVPMFTVSAYEPVSGELVWQQMTPTNSPIGSSGNLVTSGDLVLQGTDVGELYALRCPHRRRAVPLPAQPPDPRQPADLSGQRQAVHRGGVDQQRAGVRVAVGGPRSAATATRERGKVMAVSVRRAKLTAEELFELPDDGWRYELVAGELVRMKRRS